MWRRRFSGLIRVHVQSSDNSSLLEPPNGWIKNILGFHQFSMRGLHRVQAEWKLVCMALNLRRMTTMQTT